MLLRFRKSEEMSSDPAGYPWFLESIYPAVSVDDFSEVVKPPYPIIWICMFC